MDFERGKRFIVEYAKNENPRRFLIIFIACTVYILLTVFLYYFLLRNKTALDVGNVIKWEPNFNSWQPKWIIVRDENGTDVLVQLEEIDGVPGYKDDKTNPEEWINFFYYSRQNKEDPHPLFVGDQHSLNESGWDPNKDLKIIVHGYLASSESSGMLEIKNNLLDYEDVNVISVDWSEKASSVYYPSAAEKAPQVGVYLATFIEFLCENGASVNRTHIIGHSLGAHIAGFAGQFISDDKIMRITGLDPALPSFQGKDKHGRLDSEDALFVDCIHTNGGILGYEAPICAADFYPNGGSMQPGCSWDTFGSCSHSRSHEYFAESINASHKFYAYTCPGTAIFRAADCYMEGALMGYPATDEFKGVFYVDTNRNYPFAPEV